MRSGMSNGGQMFRPSRKIIADPKTQKDLADMALGNLKQNLFPTTPSGVRAKQAAHGILDKLPGHLGGAGRPRQ